MQMLPAPVGFFDEDNGNKSSMRLMCFMSMLGALGFGLLTVLGKAGPDGITVTMAFLLGAFAPKAAQKALEQKVSPTGTSPSSEGKSGG